jgi:hypothetical protein
MSRLFYHTMQDNAGNLLFDVSGTMRIAGSGTLATIYGDEALTVILPNPMTNHPSFGSFKCFLGAGDYDFYMAKAGYTFETLTGVQGHGTMAQQDASAVAITGGSAALSSATLGAAGIRTGPRGDSAFTIAYLKGGIQGLYLQPADSDAAGASAINFINLVGASVGTIVTSATATTYNTASDSRLKHAIAPLTGALDVLQALRPVRFRWNADDSEGHGFLAHELQQVVPEAVNGQPDEVHEDGSIKPQQVDHSKLVPWLTSALQEAVAQMQALAARVASLEEQLGV